MTETIPVRQDDSVPDRFSAPRLRSRAAPGWWISVGSFASVTALCAWLGYFTTFNSYGEWDDEGYLLFSLKAFAHHGGLYTHIFSVFGPFYYEAFSTVFSWLPVTLDNGRVATLVVAILASLGFGVAITMFTRSVLAGVATQAGTFFLVILSFVDESMHPSILVWLLLAVALIALALVARGQRSVGSVVLGASVAGLVLTEVNTGVFAAIALLFTGLALAPPIWGLRLPRVVAAMLFVGMPFLLIGVAGGHATESWAVKYAFVGAIAAAAVVVVTLDRGFQGLVHRQDAYRFLLGGAVMGALVVVIAVVTGTHPVDLVRGLFIDPARYSNGFTIPLAIRLRVEVWGAVCLAGAVLYRRYRKRDSPAGLVEAGLHVGVGLLILYFALQQAQVAFSTSFFWALPLLFFAAIPPFGATESERIARVAVVALAVVEGMLAYPVAGAQVRWSAILFVPAGMLCVVDGVRQLRPDLAVARRRGRRVGAALLTSVVLLASLAWLASVWFRDLSTETNGYEANTPVTLLGSNMIHLPVAQAENLETLSKAIRTQCSSFVTLPDMNSLYLWTGENPPTNWYNVWFYTVDVSLQKELVHQVEGQDRSRFCVVYNPTWWAFWAQGHVLPQLPFARFVERFEKEHGPPTLFGAYQLYKSSRATP